MYHKHVGTECVSGEGLGEWWGDSWEVKGEVKFSIAQGTYILM